MVHVRTRFFSSFHYFIIILCELLIISIQSERKKVLFAVIQLGSLLFVDNIFPCTTWCVHDIYTGNLIGIYIGE